MASARSDRIDDRHKRPLPGAGTGGVPGLEPVWRIPGEVQPPAAYPQFRLGTTAVCKTVGFAYPGSTPGPATASRRSPSSTQIWRGLLPLCIRLGPAGIGRLRLAWANTRRSFTGLVQTVVKEGVHPLAVDRVPSVDATGVTRISTSTALPVSRLDMDHQPRGLERVLWPARRVCGDSGDRECWRPRDRHEMGVTIRLAPHDGA
jgi:hypothetical protein